MSFSNHNDKFICNFTLHDLLELKKSIWVQDFQV